VISDLPPEAPTQMQEVSREATQGQLPDEKVVSSIKGLKEQGYTLDRILEIFDSLGLIKEGSSVLREQIKTVYDLDVAGFDN